MPSCQWMAEYQARVRGLLPDPVPGQTPCLLQVMPGQARLTTGAPGLSLLSSACPDTPYNRLNLLFISRYLVLSAEPIQAHRSAPKPLAHKLPSPSHGVKFSPHTNPALSVHRSILHRQINAFYASSTERKLLEDRASIM